MNKTKVNAFIEYACYTLTSLTLYNVYCRHCVYISKGNVTVMNRNIRNYDPTD